jgi:hypothetical protein
MADDLRGGEQDDDSFHLANRAFGLMTLSERERVLAAFSRLRYPSIRARFFEAVHDVIATRSSTGETAAPESK